MFSVLLCTDDFTIQYSQYRNQQVKMQLLLNFIIPCYTPVSREMPCKAITANLIKKNNFMVFLPNYPQFLNSTCD